MGIDGLNKLIREKHAELYHYLPLHSFAFKKISWDVSSWIYQFLYRQGQEGNDWLQPFIQLILLFRKNAINMVPIFDGKAPPEKDEEHAERSERKNASDERCLNVRIELQRYKNSGICNAVLKDFMKRLKAAEEKEAPAKHVSLLRPLKTLPPKQIEKEDAKDDTKEDVKEEEIKIDVEAIEADLDQKERNLFRITSENLSLLKELFGIFKIPFFQAKDEAETLACYMTRSHLVDAVFSLDSDCLAHLAPVIINEINYVTGVCRVLYLEEVLNTLELSPSRFQMFCILSSCDYNRKVKNLVNIGPVTALKLAKEFPDFESLFKSGRMRLKDQTKTDGLRASRCIELFNISYPEITNVPVWDLRINTDEISTWLRSHNLVCDIEQVKWLWRPPVVVFED
jgi:5'-3' exonuclease